ncbi:aspartyl-phosphate phosphatase Spo0E family protein [Thermoactinomyces daqus]|uniref:Aspartyl-phosphate phosphatase Spo0E family protein n=1 Tax=Thermoactinomyces daqus TaxID=1329516 RepID=A0A7W1X8T1_9BACL|nr:aspartyl-phosphate phosphatase Spo0E family protein [Thermoactinomyces daqus]MBA4542079.1 aspartyl-phosphate phosphatase Spo0E family protein [Thermoactinomyces daqus]
MNWFRSLEDKIEAVRKRMGETALRLGISHPKVYQLSRELDLLHNQWEQENARSEKNKSNVYPLRTHTRPDESGKNLNMFKAI